MIIDIAAHLTSIGFCMTWLGALTSSLVLTGTGGALMGAGVVLGLGLTD